MRYKILTYGDPRLLRKGRTVSNVTPAIRRLAADMITTMHDARGVGLAATQIGVDLRLCVIDVPLEIDIIEENGPCMNPGIPMPLVFIDPMVVAEGPEQIVQKEGCLSFPEIQAPIRRSTEITLTFTGLDGSPQILTVRHFLARAVQHEMDHLNGVLIVNRMSPVTKLSLAVQLKKLKKMTREELASMTGHENSGS